MRGKVPAIYWTFRTAWTIVHLLVVAAAAAALLTWALADNNAVRIFESSTQEVLAVQERVSNVIPWPWEAAEGSENYGTTSDGDDDYPDAEFQVIGVVNVRSGPSIDSELVDTLTDGAWITVDCVTEGSVVDPGPYQTDLDEYYGADYGPTSLWVHIPGLGYMSDAYVSTDNGSGLPQC